VSDTDIRWLAAAHKDDIRQVGDQWYVRCGNVWKPISDETIERFTRAKLNAERLMVTR